MSTSERTLGRIVSVNVGEPRTVEWHGREIRSAIWKSPVDGPVAVRGVNLAGDDQADRQVHGGTDKAVYAYAAENYRWWVSTAPATANGTAFAPGTFGDNLTTEGLDLMRALIGERWQVGSVVLEVSQPRFPCAKLGMRMDDAGFVDDFGRARRNGTYLRIVEEGQVEAGDVVTSVFVPIHDVRVGDLVEVIRNRDVASEVLERVMAVDAVLQSYRDAAARALARRRPP